MSLKLSFALAVLAGSFGVGTGVAYKAFSKEKANTAAAACCGTEECPGCCEKCCPNWCPECEACPASCLDCSTDSAAASHTAAKAKLGCCPNNACCPNGECCD